jgi:phosphate/sulfate permease
MELLAVWIVLSFVAGGIASAKGRSSVGYFLLSILLSPIIGILIAAAVPSLVYVDHSGVQRRVIRESELEDADTYVKRQVVAVAVLAVIVVAVFISLSGH